MFRFKKRDPKEDVRAFIEERTMTMCKKCYRLHYKSRWYLGIPKNIADATRRDVFLRFTKCPTCVGKEIGFYERYAIPMPPSVGRSLYYGHKAS